MYGFPDSHQLQVGPACIGVHDFLIIQFLYHNAAVRNAFNETVPFHAPECFPHRCGADSQLFGHVLFLEFGPGGKGAFNNGFHQGAVYFFTERGLADFV